MNSHNKTTTWIMAICVFAIIAMVGNIVYFEYITGNVFAPVPPQNLTEIENWQTDKIRRLGKSMNCFDIAYIDKDLIPAGQEKLYADCKYITHTWYNKSQMEDVHKYLPKK